MGKSTVNALKAFQKANGLEADGVAGKATYAVLFSDNALAEAEATPTPRSLRRSRHPRPETTDTAAPKRRLSGKPFARAVPDRMWPSCRRR